MAGKFGRAASLSLEVQPDASGAARNVTIDPNLTIDFYINRQALSSSQTATFHIFNLSPATRDLIYKDQYDISVFRAVQFRAGYGNFMPLIFNGTIKWAYSDKDAKDGVTTIEAYDGGFAMTNGFTSGWGVPGQAIPSGTQASEVINFLGKSLPKISGSPIIGSFPVANKRGEVIFGNTWNLIQQKTGGLATIDNNQVKALNLNEAIDGPIPEISSDTGLLGSPRRSGYTVEWDMLFEPRLTLFQLVSVKSTFNPRYNGVFKVIGFTHQGIISPSVGGQATTRMKILYGLNDINLVKGGIVQ